MSGNDRQNDAWGGGGGGKIRQDQGGVQRCRSGRAKSKQKGAPCRGEDYDITVTRTAELRTGAEGESKKGKKSHETGRKEGVYICPAGERSRELKKKGEGRRSTGKQAKEKRHQLQRKGQTQSKADEENRGEHEHKWFSKI